MNEQHSAGSTEEHLTRLTELASCSHPDDKREIHWALAEIVSLRAMVRVKDADFQKVYAHREMLRQALESAHFEFSLEDVNPDDNRSDVLKIMEKALHE